MLCMCTTICLFVVSLKSRLRLIYDLISGSRQPIRLGGCLFIAMCVRTCVWFFLKLFSSFFFLFATICVSLCLGQHRRCFPCTRVTKVVLYISAVIIVVFLFFLTVNFDSQSTIMSCFSVDTSLTHPTLCLFSSSLNPQVRAYVLLNSDYSETKIIT